MRRYCIKLQLQAWFMLMQRSLNVTERTGILQLAAVEWVVLLAHHLAISTVQRAAVLEIQKAQVNNKFYVEDREKLLDFCCTAPYSQTSTARIRLHAL